jgi:hypothetical protein
MHEIASPSMASSFYWNHYLRSMGGLQDSDGLISPASGRGAIF